MSIRILQADFNNLFNMMRTERAGKRHGLLSEAVCWPAVELGQALRFLAQEHDFPIATERAMLPQVDEDIGAHSTLSEAELDRWISLCAGNLGLETEPLQSTYREVDRFLLSAAPALLKLPPTEGNSELCFVALAKGGSRWLQLVGRDGSIQLVRRDLVRDMLWREVTGLQHQQLDQMLARAGVVEPRRPQVKRAVLQEMLGATVRQNGWLLRVPPSAHLWYQIRQAGLLGSAGRLVGGYFFQLMLTIGSWWMIGHSALAGHFNWGWVLGWALLLITVIPVQAWMNLTQSELAIGVGALFKQRLLFGVMQLNSEEIRHQGAGQFLGRVLASDTVEQLGLASGFVAILALFQLAAAVLILAAGIGGWFHAALLLFWVGITLVLSWFYLQRSQSWVGTYREMTNDLVERMVGHRTRLAQEERRRWHEMEDRLLDQYLRLQLRLDQVERQLKAIVPRGWMVVGVSGLLYALLFTQPTPTEIAISLGGILFAYQALTTITLGLKSVVGTRLAWREIRMLFHAAARAQALSLPRRPVSNIGTNGGPNNGVPNSAPILTARDITFRYQEHGRPVLQGCNLELQRGERLLLEGPSSGGKSTLAGILAGLRTPRSGLLLLHNVDQQSMGIGAWREKVVVVPQFHENYVLTGTLAFNLLLGREWPPRPRDIADAEALCRELGLGELIDRMPAGMQQMVGESGWQLSHGERSRVYIARALLQDAELLILDESFAALDPENLERALHCVLERAPTLVVIAHP